MLIDFVDFGKGDFTSSSGVGFLFDDFFLLLAPFLFSFPFPNFPLNADLLFVDFLLPFDLESLLLLF